MKVRFLAIIALALVLLMSCCCAAEGMISTTVVMRVSHITQDAVVNEGEDLSMEVNIDGVVPASYQWYFNDVIIDGADQKVYNIVDAKAENTGVYRMDAFDADGKMLVSMEIAARVIVDEVPKSGDDSLPVGTVASGMGVAAAGLVVAVRRKATA